MWSIGPIVKTAYRVFFIKLKPKVCREIAQL
jgi:hypothetical protein